MEHVTPDQSRWGTAGYRKRLKDCHLAIATLLPTWAFFGTSYVPSVNSDINSPRASEPFSVARLPLTCCASRDTLDTL